MEEHSEHESTIEAIWRTFLTTGLNTKEFRYRHLFGLLPANPRCRFCNAPFDGLGATLVRLVFDKRPSKLNPRLCNVCDNFASRFQGGAEIELSMLFADIRGSTNLAEGMSLSDFSRLINRFYNAATKVLIHTDALIDKVIGDQVTGLYVPGFAGPEHAHRAIEAAQEILRVTGHDSPDGPWIPLGAAVHTGTAFVGAVGSKDGTTDITVLGDAANTAARLSSNARQGEILISEAACAAAGLQLQNLEKRILELKGKSEPVSVYVMTDYSHLASKES